MDSQTDYINNFNSGLTTDSFLFNPNQGKRANGGMIPMNENSLLTAGEFVMGTEAVSMLGKGYLDDINNLRLPKPGFENGGMVGAAPVGNGGENADIGSINITVNVDEKGKSSWFKYINIAGT